MSTLRYRERQKHLAVVSLTAVVFATLTFMVMRDNGLPFLDGVNLIFHEAGHVLFFFMPPLLVAFAGTFMQLAVPIACMVHFQSDRAYIATLAALWWIGQNLIGISIYVADARTRSLMLLGNGEHDWHYILSTLGMLPYDTIIASFLSFLGFVFMVGAVAGLIWHAHRTATFAEA